MKIVIESGELYVESPTTGNLRDFCHYDKQFQDVVMEMLKQTIEDYGY